jgi:hypothetical protein
MALSDDLVRDSRNKAIQKVNNINHFKTQILLTDAEKELYDNGIIAIDSDLFGDINSTNNTIQAVKDAYQARIDSGCRTDLFWKITGFSTSGGGGSPISYDFSLEVDQLGDVGYATSITHLDSSGGITTYAAGTVVIGTGNQSDNLYGLKYYDQRYLKDIGDTTIGEFIGVVGAGSTELAIVSQISDELIQEYEPTNLVISGKEGLFSGDYNTIVGFGSTTIYSTEIETITGIATTALEVSTIILQNNTVGFTSLPESDGSYVTFTIVTDPDDEQALQERFKYSVKFTKNPFSPETIGIMNSSTLGKGYKIEVDNSGKPPETQEWKPELEGTEKKGETIKEPKVGAGKIYYKIGFTDEPVDALGDPASKGDTRSISIASYNPALVASQVYSAISQSGCSPLNTTISTAEATRDSAESSLSTTDKLNAANALREERNKYALQIWGLRQSIGGENEEVDRYNSLIGYINAQDSI